LNNNGQLGDGSTTDHTAARPVPSFAFNVDPNVSLKDDGQTAELTALANCAVGGQVHIEVELTQGNVSGTGRTVEECTGGLTRIP